VVKTLFAALALLLISVGSAAAPAPVPATPQVHPVAAMHAIYIVRHFQKAEGPDPSLTAEGAANAQRLAAMLKDKGIAAILATPTRRAMESAAPLAKLLGLRVTPYNPSDFGQVAALAAAAGGPALIVGHSNTVPDIVEYMGGARPAPLGDQDYGTVFEVEPGGKVVMIPVKLTPATERG
jgi:phosphohistidine phosphatase SixA